MSRPPQLGILQTALLNSSEDAILHANYNPPYSASLAPLKLTSIQPMAIDEPLSLRLSNHRPPLAEKQLNTMSPRRSLATVTLADSQATFLVHGNMAGESKLAPHSPLALDAMQLGYSFHPLPPLSSSSSLQLPIFLEQPFVKPSLEPPNPTSPLPKPLPTIPLPTESILKPSNNHHHTGIPALSHPNSPYVPWSLSERRSFIRPPTSASQITGFSSCLSYSHSRSGAQAPEPSENIHSPLPSQNTRLIKVTKKLKAIRRLVKHVATHLPFRDKPSHNHIHKSPIIDTSPLAPERHIHAGRFLSPSRTSLNSVDSGSLDAWLVNRRRLASEDHTDPSRCMTLEEYDRAGSWINVSDTTPCSETSCSTQTSELHAFPVMIEARTYSIDPQVSLLWFPDDPSAPISSSLMDSPSPSHSSPSPQLPVCNVKSKACSVLCMLRPSPSRDSAFSSKIHRARTLSMPNNPV